MERGGRIQRPQIRAGSDATPRRARRRSLAALVLIVALALDCALILVARAQRNRGTAAGKRSALVCGAAARRANPQLLLATVVNAHLFGVGRRHRRRRQRAGDHDAADPRRASSPIRTRARAGDHRRERRRRRNCTRSTRRSPGGARLHAVYADRVLLERNGGLETLLLPRTPLTGGAASGSSAPPVPGPRRRCAENPSLLGGPGARAAGVQAGQAQWLSHLSGRTERHQRVQSARAAAGDLIVAVNGTPLEDPARAMEVLQTLSSSGQRHRHRIAQRPAQEVNLNLAPIVNEPVARPSAGHAAADGDSTADAPEPMPPHRARCARRRCNGHVRPECTRAPREYRR